MRSRKNNKPNRLHLPLPRRVKSTDDGGYTEPPARPVSSTKYLGNEEGTVLQRKEEDPTGFWISNEFMDKSSRRLGARGVYLYLWLLRAATLRTYPTVHELAKITRKSEYMIARLLYKAFVLGELNSADMVALGLPAAKDLAEADEWIGNNAVLEDEE